MDSAVKEAAAHVQDGQPERDVAKGEQKAALGAAALPPLPPSPPGNPTALEAVAPAAGATEAEVNSGDAAQGIGSAAEAGEQPEAPASREGEVEATAALPAPADPLSAPPAPPAAGATVIAPKEATSAPQLDVEMASDEPLPSTSPSQAGSAPDAKDGTAVDMKSGAEKQEEVKEGEAEAGVGVPDEDVKMASPEPAVNGHSNGVGQEESERKEKGAQQENTAAAKEKPSPSPASAPAATPAPSPAPSSAPTPAPAPTAGRPKKYIFVPPVMGSEDDYEKLELVGKGTYGEVYKARNKATKEIVAMKQVDLANQNDGIPITAVREIKILRTLKHENVIGLKAIVTNSTRTKLTMVIEYMDHDLTGLFHMHRKWLNENHIKCFAKQLIEGLFHCHGRKVLHRDIKGANMLVNNDGILKLADFGLARRIREDGKYTNRVVTLWYRAPELLLGAVDYGPAVDMWCILVEMYTGRVAFSGKDEMEQLSHIFAVLGTPQDCPGLTELDDYKKMKPKQTLKPALRQHLQKLDPKCVIPPETFDLIKQLLELDPRKRITAAKALGHDYFYKGAKICAPSEIPHFRESCHELEAKKQRTERDKLNSQKNKKFKDNKGQAHHAGPHRGQRHQGQNRNSRDRVDYHRRDRRDQRGQDNRRWQQDRHLPRHHYPRTHNPEYQPPPRHMHHRDHRNRGYSHSHSHWQDPDHGPLVTPDYSYKRTEEKDKAGDSKSDGKPAPSAGVKRKHSEM